MKWKKIHQRDSKAYWSRQKKESENLNIGQLKLLTPKNRKKKRC